MNNTICRTDGCSGQLCLKSMNMTVERIISEGEKESESNLMFEICRVVCEGLYNS
ncbi:unnamed protein product [Rhodiola kirilowii]